MGEHSSFGGQVIIEISDDSAGLDSEKLRRKAVVKGLITIFLPGFSRAEKSPMSPAAASVAHGYAGGNTVQFASTLGMNVLTFLLLD
jgi:hypothetical protein